MSYMTFSSRGIQNGRRRDGESLSGGCEGKVKEGRGQGAEVQTTSPYDRRAKPFQIENRNADLFDRSVSKLCSLICSRSYLISPKVMAAR